MKRIWTKLIIVGGIWLTIFILHRIGHSYVTISEDRNVAKEEELAFTTMPPKSSPRVIFIGNCVFQTTQVIPYLNKVKKVKGLEFETGNFSRQGATVGDLLVTYNYIKRFKPDLVIIHLDPFAFGYHEPFYKHTSRKLLFAPGMDGLRHPDVLKTYTNNELAESALYSLFPVYRLLPAYRYHTNEAAKKFVAPYIKWPVLDFFPYSLIPNFKFLNVSDKAISTYQFPMAKAVMQQFVNQLEKDGQDAVFIFQESGEDELPVMSEIPEMFKGRKHVYLYNLRPFWNRTDFLDKIHPREPRGSKQAAARLFYIVKKHLVFTP